MSFVDSYDEKSSFFALTHKYRHTFRNEGFIFGGIAAGFVETSYRKGIIGLPFAGFGYKSISLNLSYLPNLKNTDELLMGLLSVKLFEW